MFWEVRVEGGVRGLAYHFYDKLPSQFNYERIFWKQSKRYCGNSSTEIKGLVSSCLKWREFYNFSIQEPEINAPAFTGQQLSILSHVTFVTLEQTPF